MADKSKIELERERLIRAIESAPGNYRARLQLKGTFTCPAEHAPPAVDAGRRGCPCCNNTFSRFLPGGPTFRPNACCPACESLERHRYLCLVLAQSPLLISSPATMVHIAPEPCLTWKFRAMFGKGYHSTDLAKSADFLSDMRNLPVIDESVNILVANHVLEHIHDDVAAIREIYRVLKPQGVAMLQVPLQKKTVRTREAPKGTPPEERLRLFGQEDHVRTYGADFPDRLLRQGFEVREYVCEALCTEEQILFYGLSRHESLWIAAKPQ